MFPGTQLTLAKLTCSSTVISVPEPAPDIEEGVTSTSTTDVLFGITGSIQDCTVLTT